MSPEMLDLRGMRCPLPLIRLTARLEELAPEECCLVMADDPGFMDDLPFWCDETGHQLLSLTEDAQGVIRAELKKHHPPGA